MSDEKTYEELLKENMHYRKVLEAQKAAIENLEKKYTEAIDRNQFLEQQIVNADRNLGIVKQNMIAAITEQNRVQNEYGLEIRMLRDKIKRLEDKSV